MLDWKKLNGKKICVAVSGGVDSMALTHYLRARSKEYGFSLSAVHCEHGIRGQESVLDMEFVAETCEKWGIPLVVFREDCVAKAEKEKCSLEVAARAFRYDVFSGILRGGVDFIATAHHQKDEAETVLFRLARGTALGGVAGMHAKKREQFIRPFLDWSKETVLEYARKNGVEYREDCTNALTDATRNKIRLNVLPALEEAVPGAVKNIARFAALAAEDEACLIALAKDLITESNENGKSGYVVAFCNQKPLFCRAALLVVKALGLEKDYTTAHLESVFQLQGLERGAKAILPKDVYAEKTKKGVFFAVGADEKRTDLADEKPFDESGFDGGRYCVKISATESVGGFGKVLRLDKDKLPKDATFRFRKEGDFIVKFGGAKKTLKKYLNEEEVPVLERATLPLIAQKDGKEVYAVCGYEISNKIKVTDETKNVLFLAVERK